MPTQVQFRRGTTAQNNNFTGALAEISVDTDLNVIRVHNGSTQGGFALAGTSAAQTLSNKVYQGTSVSVTGDVTGGNIITSGIVSATGNVTGNYLLGNGTFITGLSASKIFNGTSEANIGSSGGNANISIGGVSNVVVISSAGATITGALTVTGNINATGNINYQDVTNLVVGDPLIYLAANAVGNTDDIGIVGNFDNGTYQHTGLARDASDGVWKLFSNVIPEPTTTIDFTNAIYDPLKTGAITATSGAYSLTLSAAGNVTGGNVLTAGLMSATGTITGSQFIGSGAGLTAIPAANVTGTLSVNTTGSAATLTTSRNINGVAFNGSADITVTAAAGTLTGTTLNSTVVTSSLTTVGALNAGSITSGFGAIDIGTDTITCGGIVNAGANATGNIGSSSTYFNTVFAKATSAQYADLAEMYVADADYAPGTVVEFGGNFEITKTTSACSTAVAGIISTNPSYLMNSTQSGEYVLPVALTGRVPCQVQGPVKKGDVLISSDTPGVAQRIGVNWQPGCTLGKAMENISTSEIKVIEVAVGRL